MATLGRMPYPRPYYRLVVSGTLPGGESWSYGLAMNTMTSGDYAGTLEDVPQGVIDAVHAYHTSGLISSDAKLTEIKMNAVGTDGKYLSRTATTLHEEDTPLPGGSSASNQPYQVAVAISLLTTAKRGPGHRGRYYLPAPYIPNGAISAGELSISFCEAAATASATFINALNAVGGPNVVVASNVGATGAIMDVTGIAVGSRPDIIRSRGKSLVETYHLAAITPT